MSAFTVDLDAGVLQWVIAHSDARDTDTMTTLQQWASGEMKPTLGDIERMSRKTDIPFGYFFLSTPPADHDPLADYRTAGSFHLAHPSRNLVDTIYRMQDIQDWMADYRRQNEIPGPPFVGRFDRTTPSQVIVQDMRDTLGLEVTWFRQKNSRDNFSYLRNSFESVGILVLQNGIVGLKSKRKLDIAEFRAFCLYNDLAPLIFINTNDSNNGKIFSLVHEAAHLWTGTAHLCGNDMPQDTGGKTLEAHCNRIASELLVPKNIFMDKWDTIMGDSRTKIESLSQYFKCSMQVIIRRARDLQYIAQAEFESLNRLAMTNAKAPRSARAEGGEFYATQISRLSRQFITALNRSVLAGQTLYRDAYRLTNTNGKTFKNLVEKAEGA